MVVTETGLYYPDILREIWYTHFETKQAVNFYGGKEREQIALSLITYDSDYIYLLQNKNIGYDMENNFVVGIYLVRVPREGGDALSYLSMEMTKTEDGFRVKWYGIAM